MMNKDFLFHFSDNRKPLNKFPQSHINHNHNNLSAERKCSYRLGAMLQSDLMSIWNPLHWILWQKVEYKDMVKEHRPELGVWL